MTRDQIVATVRALIGTPYLHQASVKGVGCDCLGVIRYVWREVVGPEPEPPPTYSRDWAEARAEETLKAAFDRHMTPVPVDAAQPGDVLLFAMTRYGPAKHCGVLVPDQRLVHAVEGHPVAEVSLKAWLDGDRRQRRRQPKFAYAFPGVES